MDDQVKNILKTSYLNQNEAKNQFQQMGFIYDKDLSTNESKVFVDKRGNPNIVFRGTIPRRTKDLVSDLSILTGLEGVNPRFKQTKELTKEVERKYQKPANVYGDSLGGTLAERSGASGKIITHNKGTGFFDIGKTIPKNQIDYRNTNDVVSLLSLTQNHLYNNLVQKKTGKSELDILGNHQIL